MTSNVCVAPKMKKKFVVKEIIETKDTYKIVRGEDSEKGVPVIIKIFNENSADDIIAVNTFRRECRLIRQLKTTPHPNIVRIYYIEPTMTCNYYVLEYLQCDSLKEYAAKNGKLGGLQAIEMIIQLTEALSFIHKKHKIVHRDIQPENILITPQLVPKFYNLGAIKSGDSISLTTDQTVIKGSRFYTAPEVNIEDKEYTVQSDIYSLGLILHFMLTGDHHFQNIEQVVSFATNGEPAPKLPQHPEIEELLATMVNRDPAKRPGDHETLIEHLEYLKARLSNAATSDQANTEARIARLEAENAEIKEKLKIFATFAGNMQVKLANAEQSNAEFKRKIKIFLEQLCQD